MKCFVKECGKSGYWQTWAKAIGASALIDAASCAFDSCCEFQYSYDSKQIGLQCAFDGKIRWHK
jgi:hypothetical protein